MKDLEKIYDEEISPLVEKILDISKKHNVPMFVEFQYSDDGFCRAFNPVGHDVYPFYHAVSQCKEDSGINVDKLMMWVAKGARETGHSSLVLSQMGVPIAPSEETKI